MFDCRRIVVVLAFLASCCTAWAAPTPNYRALLVGVTAYPHLEKRDLRGPKNDVASMRKLLLDRGFKDENIRVLADGVESSKALPTKGAIVGELRELARTAKPDDYIVILLGGHGAQLPIPAGHPAAASEDDGLFEVFLPRDTQRWTGKTGAEAGDVQNHLPDHELRALVDRITATGAFVWVIVDSCHSGTLVRSGGDSGGLLRQVSAADLGVPQAAIDAAQQRARQRKPTARNPAAQTPARPASVGRAVYFYAAQPHNATPEERLPSGDPNRVDHGLFSFTVMRGLRTITQPISYDQLGRWVRSELATSGYPRAVNPEFGGTQLDAQVLATTPLPRPREWLLRAGTDALVVAGGLTHELGQGSIVAILPSEAATEAQAIGYARVERAGALESTLVPVAFRQTPLVPRERLREGRVARLVQPGLLEPLVVYADLTDCAAPCLFRAAVQQLRAAAQPQPVNVRWLDAPAGAQLVLKAQGKRLWFLPPRSKLSDRSEPEKYFSHLEATPQGLAEDIQEGLSTVSRATRLMRLSSALAQSGANARLQVQVFPVVKTGSGEDAFRRTGPAMTDMGPRKVGELVEFELTNQSRLQMDVIAFYVDSKFGICELYPAVRCGDPKARVDASTGPLSGNGGEGRFRVSFNDGSLGQERVILIARERDTTFHQPIDLSFLQQAGVRSVSAERSGNENAWLSRDGGPEGLPPSAAMFVYTVDLRE